MKRLVRILLGTLLALTPLIGAAHSGSASYVRLNETAAGLAIAVSLDLNDAEYAFGIDLDRNGEITWGELEARRLVFEEYVRERVRPRRDGAPCEIAFAGLEVDAARETVFGVLEGVVACRGASVTASALDAELMFDLDAAHRTLVEWRRGERTSVAVLTNGQRSWRLEEKAGWGSQLLSFVREGMFHIWSGFDHLAFLLVLLLPVFANGGRERAAPWRRLVAIVTAFTLAHSITLALAIGGIVSLPERPIEVAIAASVVIAAITNMIPGSRAMGAWTAFAFGLLHGFGFAGALAGLAPTQQSLAVALAGFNVGVELGQLAVVTGALPLLYWLRARPSYATHVVRAASFLTAIAGVFWVCERVAA